jgi:hypothetical protein
MLSLESSKFSFCLAFHFKLSPGFYWYEIFGLALMETFYSVRHSLPFSHLKEVTGVTE